MTNSFALTQSKRVVVVKEILSLHFSEELSSDDLKSSNIW
jgi:hypothetical protein